MGAWLAAIAALPKIISQVRELVSFLEKLFGPDWNKKLAVIIESYDKLEVAKTDEERLKIISSIIAARNG